MILTFDVKPGKTFATFCQETRRAYLVGVLQRSGGSVTQAAKMADINRTDLYSLMQRYELLEYAQGLRENAADIKDARRAESAPFSGSLSNPKMAR